MLIRQTQLAVDGRTFLHAPLRPIRSMATAPDPDGSTVLSGSNDKTLKALALKAVQGVTGIAGEVAIEVADLLRVSAGFAAGAASLVDMVGGVPFIKVRATLLLRCPTLRNGHFSTSPPPRRVSVHPHISPQIFTLRRPNHRSFRCSRESWRRPCGYTNCARR